MLVEQLHYIQDVKREAQTHGQPFNYTLLQIRDRGGVGPRRGEGESTLIRRVCATGVLNCSVLKWKIPKSIPYSGAKSVNHISCSGVTTPFLNQMYCIVLYST